MRRIFPVCVDMIAAMVFLLPIFLVCHKLVFHKVKHTAMNIIFACYLIAVMSLVGLPNVTYVRFDLTGNLIPFADMIPDMKNALLNVLLFVPMGFFLPVLWEKYRNLKSTALMCLCLTVMIEVLQIFTYRATDINDIITNTLGGVIGFWAAKAVTKGFSRLVCKDTKHDEVYLVLGISFAVMFFGVPFVSDFLWGFIP